MKRTLSLIGLTVLVSACQPASVGTTTLSPTATEPTRTVAADSVALLSYDGIGVCSAPLGLPPSPWQTVDPKEEYYGATTDPMSDALDGFAEAIGYLGATAFTSDRSREALRASILEWAAADAMQWPRDWNSGSDSGPATVFFTTHTMVPVVIAYGEHRGAFSLEEQVTIETWMKRLVDRTGNNERMRRWTLDNKGYLWGSLALAYGIIADENAYIQRGVETYRTAIRASGPTAAFPTTADAAAVRSTIRTRPSHRLS